MRVRQRLARAILAFAATIFVGAVVWLCYLDPVILIPVGGVLTIVVATVALAWAIENA